VDNLIASLGIPSFRERIRVNRSKGVPCQESLPVIATLMALANLGVFPEGSGGFYGHGRACDPVLQLIPKLRIEVFPIKNES